ncbi:Memo-like protein [uncultured archaeon]|nr:Memo-like protein [uncultured archaeon]
MNSSHYIEDDENAHENEHSIEVQLPFVRHALGDVKCVFICMGDQSLEACELLAESISKTARLLRRRVAVLASSDFDHYDPADVAKKKDLPAIGALARLDTAGFNDLLSESGDTACGHGPITVAALFAKAAGAKEGRLLKYANSGDVTKDKRAVVAYASIVFR